MHATLSVALVAVIALCAQAAPVPAAKALSKRHFRTNVGPRHRSGSHRNPTAAMVRAYEKYGWEIVITNPQDALDLIFGSSSSTSQVAVVPTPTSSATVASMPTTTTQIITATAPASTSAAPAAADDGENGEVAALPESNESEYLSPVTIGGQKLNLDFDTGSADLWVFSSLMPSRESAGHGVFDPSKSTTWSEYATGHWKISYGDGSGASGTVGFDVVDIGGATVTRQAVELATAVSGSFVTDENNDGLVGLGFSSINTIQPQAQKTFFESIMPELDLPLFTANLEEDASGTYNFGEIDAEEYSGEIHYTPIDKSNGFWQFDSNTYTIGGQESQCTACSPAIADTGTSLVLVDDDVATAYYAQVTGSYSDASVGGYCYPCSSTLPDFGVAIGSNYTAVIKGEDVTFAQVSSTLCFGGVQSNGGGDLQIYGDVLLKQFLAVFDGGNESFGLANKA